MTKENKLFYLGTFSEATFGENDEMIKEAELFSTGTHRGQEYTEEDLQELVDNFSESDEIPVQLDHSESARDTVGYLKEVNSKGGKLLGKLHIIDEYAKERIDKGLMKKLSIGFYLKFTEDGIKPHKLREVSLVAFPQVKSARLFSENGYVSDYEEQGGQEMTQINLAELKAELKKELETEIHSQYSELQTEVERLKGQNVSFTEAQIDAKVANFTEAGKAIPAQKDALTALLKSFSEEQTQLFENFMKEAKAVDFQEQGEIEQHDEQGEKDERTQEQKDFDAFYEAHANKFGRTL